MHIVPVLSDFLIGFTPTFPANEMRTLDNSCISVDKLLKEFQEVHHSELLLSTLMICDSSASGSVEINPFLMKFLRQWDVDNFLICFLY